MNNRVLFYIKALFFSALVGLILIACNSQAPTNTPTAEDTPNVLTSPAVSETELPVTETPSPTPIPLAARVDQIEISLAEYEAELALFQAALGKELTEDDKTRVLDDLIDQALLAQAAIAQGFQLDEAALQARIEDLAKEAGGAAALDAWVTTQGYTEELFRQALGRSLVAAWMRDQVVKSVPGTAEQIHARQILLLSAEEADEVYAMLQAGNDFGNLALEYDPLTGGDLGWFPRGYLPHLDLEEAAFSLEVDQYSQVIETLAGFHIIQVLEREPNRALEPDALLVLQTQALIDWLAQQRIESEIHILIP